MDDQQLKYARLLGVGRLQEIKEMVNGKFLPCFDALAMGLELALQRVDPAAVEYALNWGVDKEDGGRECYHLYSKPWKSNATQKWSYGGMSPWNALIRSGGSPGEKNFDQCVKLLCTTGLGINEKFDLDDKDDNQERLVHFLMFRGWHDLGTRIEKLSQRKFNVNKWISTDKLCTPLEMALRSGHGQSSVWCVSHGGKASGVEAIRWAAAGAVRPASPSNGAFIVPSWEDRVLAIRVGAKMAGLSGIDGYGYDFKSITTDPLESPGKLLCWLMVKGALAQRASAKGKAERIRDVAPLAAKKLGLSWGAVEKAAKEEAAKEEGGAKRRLFGVFSKTVSTKARDEHERVIRLAVDAIRERDEQQPDLSVALPLIDEGKFDKAGQAMAHMPEESKLDTCVALLGLAKAGYWDMPMPQIEALDAQERHPMRWAGFKLALMACGDKINSPIPELSGATLAGVCAALGFEDALSELIDARVALDPDEMSQGPSPLWLALRNKRVRFAQVLINSGASPMEGVKPSVFGYPSREWAIHMAFDQELVSLVESMLASDPRCAKLPNKEGKTVLDRARDMAADSEESSRDLGAKFVSIVEKSIMAECSVAKASSRGRSL